MSHRVYLSLGSNLGESPILLQKAFKAIDKLEKVSLISCSPLYQSEPVGCSGPDYLNAAVEIRTDHQPEVLLQKLQQVESDFGRERPYPWAPRTLDIDMLFFDQICLNSSNLTLPHPRIFQRAFVLQPLLDLGCPYVTFSDLNAVESQLLIPYDPSKEPPAEGINA